MTSVAVIVPFRVQVGQTREEELDEFLPYMKSYLQNEKNFNNITRFHIYVIKQYGTYGDDLKKFNRGLLLNIGFSLTNDLYNTFIFHDVDLLPSDSLSEYYSMYPKKPIHIAGCWQRYNGNRNYFGGIVSFDRKCFNIINGFPNDFWGWGGEDDALLNRCIGNKIKPYKIEDGGVLDIENGIGYELEEKLQVLRDNKEFKCLDKWERIEEDRLNWRENGLRQIHDRFKILSFETINDHTMIEVEIE